MGLIEILKSIIPENILKIDNSRRIEITNSGLIIEGNNIENPEILKRFLD